MDTAPRQLGSFFYRDRLSPLGQQLYDAQYRRLRQGRYDPLFTPLLTIRQNLTTEAVSACEALRNDHPEFFFLGSSIELVGSPIGTRLQFALLHPSSQIPALQKRLRRELDLLTRDLCGCSLLKRELLVYERIALRCTYQDTGNPIEHTIVGPLLHGRGVCEGQNAVLLLAFRALGIPCIKLIGRSSRCAHCWCVAWLGGVPVHCDVTWDRPGSGGKLRFRYFNRSDRQISADHFGFRAPGMPVCRSEGYCFSPDLPGRR